MKFNKKSLDYARIYYKLEQILAEKDKIEELEKQGYGRNGIYQLTRPTLNYKLVRMFEVLKDEKIDDIDEMMRFIMQTTKGQNNPKVIECFLKNEIKKLE